MFYTISFLHKHLHFLEFLLSVYHLPSTKHINYEEQNSSALSMKTFNSPAPHQSLMSQLQSSQTLCRHSYTHLCCIQPFPWIPL